MSNCLPAELYHHGGLGNQDVNSGFMVVCEIEDIRIQEAVVNTLQARMGTGGNNMPLVTYPIQGNVIGRLPENGPGGKGFGEDGDPMFTLTKLDQHAIASNSVVRRLTPVECERLQGFPDNWTEGQADTHRYKQMGNAVAVPVVEWIMQRLVEVDQRD